MFSYTKSPLLSSLLLLLFPLCVPITGLPFENNTSQSESNNSTIPQSSMWDLLRTSSPNLKSNHRTVSQSHELTQSQKTTHEQILYVTENVNYGNEEDDDDEDDYYEVYTDPPHAPAEPCPYDRCKHLELPCNEIQKKAGGRCLCPGISGRSVIPDSPRLKQIIPGQTGMGVNWCSPLSTVTGYRVLYGRPEERLEMGPLLNQSHRFFSIANLLPGTSYRVCVVAINDAGQSQVQLVDGEEGWDGPGGILGPCGIFYTFDSQDSYIYLAIGVGLAIFACLLGFFVIIYWVCKRKKVRNFNEGGGMGVTNMSFKAESIENL
ncbi:LRRN4 C-terminal-like protein [Pseudophryne corroboree]|uniref:LRRN4 C-terminal-like protein n=1 Tax=Pseudophryne corroboree TaxID=495146 RepID=UPI003081D535